ncbi:methyltransferase domain-containing protein [Desulfobacula sp.]|uniref:class I SAM-dependent methyltransferase n=1 Tax=Desulfobacula sp. TaxID=2593537 RepID=UPI0026353795|nr:methyltransferase domain-containing protein [Desulfobacula sp.]
MINANEQRVCPVENAGSLDNVFRKWLQNPEKILRPYIQPGMSVMDFGCGPGFFTMEMAQMVGEGGKVFAVDLQEGMLQKLKEKIRLTELENRIQPHQCKESGIGVSESLDFVLAFYVVHEVPDQEAFFHELKSIVQPGGKVLVAEPPFHVSKKVFHKCLQKARKAGFNVEKGPSVVLSKTALLSTDQYACSKKEKQDNSSNQSIIYHESAVQYESDMKKNFIINMNKCVV